jgi:hypothetical protein
MDFRTTFEIEASGKRIGYSTPVMFLGSCFASEMSNMMAKGKMQVLSNPAGTVFNPVSVQNTLELIIGNREIKKGDLHYYNGTFLSFLHYTSFNSENAGTILSKINESTSLAHNFLEKARFLFITFGTARIYRFRESGQVVSNCHKMPASMFSEELLTPEQIAAEWHQLLGKLAAFNRKLSVIFTVSPVRHWKDGAHGNQVSKSTLFLAIEKLLEKKSTGYFPAYELLMDDLRDYRFYDSDMLHPSGEAVNYIWDAFANCYFDAQTIALWKKISSLTASVSHRFISGSAADRFKFAATMLKQIEAVKKSISGPDFSAEIAYFRSILETTRPQK